MDKKRKFKIVCSCIIVISLFIVSLRYLTNLMELKNSDSKYLSFVEQKENYDVLFMGSSHVILGVYPMELWKDYGIVSYNMGGHSNRIPTTYWVMENALEQTNPKLIVIDCFYLHAEEKTSDIFSYVHTSFDAFPLNSTKLSATQDLLDDPEMDKMIQEGTARELRERTEMELLWDFSIYHTRWNELSEQDFVVSDTNTKGAEYIANVEKPIRVTKISAEKRTEGETTGVRYLRKMIEDCQNRGIEVLLVYVPFPAGERGQLDANRVYDIADEYGVDYINFLDMDVVDYNTDCADTDSHLNVSGALKVTEYLGQYITEHYDIPDQRSNPAYENWYKDYEKWSQEKIKAIWGTDRLDIYLMLLADGYFEAEIEINNPKIWDDEYYVSFLKNIGVDEDDYGIADDFNDEDGPDVRITVRDRVTQEFIVQKDFSL